MTAWGANPCQEENTLPGVYSRVSVAKPWIEKVTAFKALTYLNRMYYIILSVGGGVI